jgi:hypothetical protein
MRAHSRRVGEHNHHGNSRRDARPSYGRMRARQHSPAVLPHGTRLARWRRPRSARTPAHTAHIGRHALRPWRRSKGLERGRVSRQRWVNQRRTRPRPDPRETPVKSRTASSYMCSRCPVCPPQQIPETLGPWKQTFQGPSGAHRGLTECLITSTSGLCFGGGSPSTGGAQTQHSILCMSEPNLSTCLDELPSHASYSIRNPLCSSIVSDQERRAGGFIMGSAGFLACLGLWLVSTSHGFVTAPRRVR